MKWTVLFLLTTILNCSLFAVEWGYIVDHNDKKFEKASQINKNIPRNKAVPLKILKGDWACTLSKVNVDKVGDKYREDRTINCYYYKNFEKRDSTTSEAGKKNKDMLADTAIGGRIDCSIKKGASPEKWITHLATGSKEHVTIKVICIP